MEEKGKIIIRLKIFIFRPFWFFIVFKLNLVAWCGTGDQCPLGQGLIMHSKAVAASRDFTSNYSYCSY